MALRPSDLNNYYWCEAIFIDLLKYINKINFSYQKRFKKYLRFYIKKKSAMFDSNIVRRAQVAHTESWYDYSNILDENIWLYDIT